MPVQPHINQQKTLPPPPPRFNPFFFCFSIFLGVFFAVFLLLQSIFGKFEICNSYIFHTFVLFQRNFLCHSAILASCLVRLGVYLFNFWFQYGMYQCWIIKKY